MGLLFYYSERFALIKFVKMTERTELEAVELDPREIAEIKIQGNSITVLIQSGFEMPVCSVASGYERWLLNAVDALKCSKILVY